MIIYVFERFNTTKGELYETINVDFLTPHNISHEKIMYNLVCDFRLPYEGYLNILHPTNDALSLDLEYSTPTCPIINYIPGIIKETYFTDALRNIWERLPLELEICLTDNYILHCKKEIIDIIECSVDGFLYIYRPTMLELRSF